MGIYAAHQTPDVLEELHKNNFELLYVPGNCTSELQPLDSSFNGPLKEKCKDKFAQWYAQVCDDIRAKDATGEPSKDTAQSVQPDLRLSVIKPLHCQCLIDAFSELSSRQQLITQEWETNGILGELMKIKLA